MHKAKSKNLTLKILMVLVIITLILILSILLIDFIILSNNKSKPQEILKAPSNQTETIPLYYSEIKPLIIENISNIDNVDSKLMNKSYWVNNLPSASKLIMSKEEIKEFNINNFNTVRGLYDINSYPDATAGDKIKNYIKMYSFPSTTMYDKLNNVIPNSIYDEIKNNINLESLGSTVKIKYAIALTRAPLKSFPSDIEAYKKSSTFDRFQETAIEACEKIIILHQSKDKMWSFVESYNYRGWIRNKDICISSLQEVDYFANPKKFITILQNAAELNQDNKQYKYFMGVKLPIEYKGLTEEYITYIPVKDSEGNLVKKPITLDKNLDYCTGYLPYTRENIILQAFKQLGTSYGWGDTYNGRDCSSFIAATFKTMGIYFPRNTDEQELLNFKSINLKDLSNEDKDKKIDSLNSGDLLYMDGHVVMYLGEHNSTKYIIHNSPGSGLTTTVDKCDLKTSSGTTYTKLYTKALIIEY